MEKLRSLFSKYSSHSFQILSDLHLEVGQQYSTFIIPPSAPYLVLAGDIGRLIDYDSYLAFLTRQTQAFEKVFLVLGNHEFYGLSFTAGLEQARKLEIEPILNGRLVLLHQNRFDVPNSSISILGCTLWSKIQDDARQVVQIRVKDFEKILDWSVVNHNAAHEADISWLKGQIADIQKAYDGNPKKQPERTIIIVTHHAPSTQETSNPQHIDNPWSSAFATNLLNGEDWSNVKLWVFGHTHFTTEFKKDGIRIVSNQRGYVLPGSVQRKKNEKNKKRLFDVRKVVYV
jgi:predicted phosphodiesterase